MKQTSIQKFIHLFRKQQVRSELHRGLFQCAIINIFLLTMLCIFETIFYFNIPIRITFTKILATIFISSFSYILLRAYFHSNTIFNNSNDHTMAKRFMKRNATVNDRLLNALELEESLNTIKEGKDLAKHAIQNLDSSLNKISKSSLYDPVPGILKKLLLISISIFFILLTIFYDTLPAGLYRLSQPNTEFPIPLPFTLNSLSKNQQVLGGDTLTISIAGYGKLPDSISIYLENDEKTSVISSPKNAEVYEHTFYGIKKNTTYWAEYKSSYLFSPWDKITTTPDTIHVIDRPVIHDLSFTIIPPEYTMESEFQHPKNIANITIPEGSRLQILGKASKILQRAWMRLDDKQYVFNTQGDSFTGGAPTYKEKNAIIYVQDENGVNNLHPNKYQLNIIPDSAPDIIVQSPRSKFELDESNFIEFDIQTSDDYGFSNAWIEYQIKAPEYITQDTSTYKRNILEIQYNVKSQQIYHSWDLSNFELAPDDEIHMQIAIADNNILSGPSIIKSQTIVGRYPSLEDLFMRLEEEEEEIEEYSEDIHIAIEDVQELVEELELELLKSDEVTWEQEQKVAKTMEQMDEIYSQIEKIQESMQKIQEQAEKNNLVSEDLIDKFSQFQNLLDEVMTPELLEAMEKMQQAMDEMDPQKLLDALEDFEFDLEGFEEQLDRFIDMFELALAEQKMDEVVKRLEKLVEEQTAIVNELNQNNIQDLQNIASRERRQEEFFKSLEQTMNDAAEAMEELSSEAAQKLKELAESTLTDNTAKELKQARENMQSQNHSNASQSAIQANSGLEEMLTIAQDIQSEFQEDTVDEMLRKFLALIQNLLFISQEQEKLITETKGIRSRSPLLIDIAVKQDRILRENQQFIIQLMDLSRQTFHISPKIANAIGKTKTAMDKAIIKLEQRQTSSAKKEMTKSLKELNQIAYLLLESADQMQMSGSGSGFAQFMEQMEQMGQAQQGINKGTMQLPQLSMMGQQKMMQQLQQQQEQLKQQLEELLGNNPGQNSGGLSKANEDMEEVIEDFRKRQVDRRTQERQQRILSRMLDSQKSLTQKDYSEKRKSNSAKEVMYAGPMGLPMDKGERDMLIINAMESALQEGHSREYQVIMKQYFRELQKEENILDE